MWHSNLHRLLGFLVLAASLLVGWLWQDYQNFLDGPMTLPEEGVVYQVRPGTGLGHIARDLAERGVLDQPLYLRLHGRQSELARQIHSGEFHLPTGLTPRQLLPLLVSGKVVEYPLTLLEGWTFTQVRQALAANEVLVQTIGELSDEQVMAAIGQPGQHPEGRFFPDTYRFPRGTTDLEFLRRAHERMASVLTAAWTARAEDLPISSMDQALVLASIVEKETGLASERRDIAGVFSRRLRKGMRLQTDPTVIYGLGERFDGNLRRRDLRRDTPYNTYTRAGLPPTPICMPGAESIHAALNPADGDALYFVSRGDGSHQFSATLAAHNEAVRRYQLKRKK
jgi:UPF0755 protein